MLATLFAMSWVGFGLLLLGIYLVVVVIRGIIDLVRWFQDEYAAGSTSRKNRRQGPKKTA